MFLKPWLQETSIVRIASFDESLFLMSTKYLDFERYPLQVLCCDKTLFHTIYSIIFFCANIVLNIKIVLWAPKYSYKIQVWWQDDAIYTFKQMSQKF